LNLYYQPDFSEQNPVLSGTEAHHVLSVMRHQAGDQLQITNGSGLIFNCALSNKSSSACTLNIHEIRRIPAPTYQIHIALGILKASDRMEWFVEKATEIGVQKISFFTSGNCERKIINLDRLHRVAISALKQSGQSWLPLIAGPERFESVIANPNSQLFIGYIPDHIHVNNLLNEAIAGNSYLVLIGPEGDFTPAEFKLAVSKGFRPISLGNNVMRSETAALSAVQILNLLQVKS